MRQKWDVGWFNIVCLEHPLNNKTCCVPRQCRSPNSWQADKTPAPRKEQNLRKGTRTLQGVRRGQRRCARRGAFYPTWRESSHFVGNSAPLVTGGNVVSEPDGVAVAECRPMSQRLRFDSQSGRVPQLWARSLVGICRRRQINDYLSSWNFLSLPSSL